MSKPKKPKPQEYKPSESDKMNASVAMAEYEFFKQNYDPLLQKMRDESLTEDTTSALRARSNADTMQALTSNMSLQEAQRIGAGADMAQAVQGQLGQANVAGKSIQNQLQTNVLGTARGQAADAQKGMAQASRLGTSEALARAKANQDVAFAKSAAVNQVLGTAIGAGLSNKNTRAVNFNEDTGKFETVSGSFFKPAQMNDRTLNKLYGRS